MKGKPLELNMVFEKYVKMVVVTLEAKARAVKNK